MGLDITAYSKIKPAPNALDDKGELIDWDNHFQANLNPDFPGRADDVEDGKAYSFEKEYRFRAGSCSGYDMWREQLAKMAGYPAVKLSHGSSAMRHDAGAWAASGGPFWELINFSDCEGTLGTAVCKKLLADFDQFASDAEKDDSYFKERYRDWHKAVKLAADDGCIDFH
jgi:hypothetical protein